ncbi:MAG: class I SAM-dependent methyltransferase [Patescibacteria group bacterium]|nr:class I SAM-dependent methyltransferase [Patescibacteria group bacterium]
MQNTALYDKYSKGRHWDQHSRLHAEFFAFYLMSDCFQGKLVDLGCGAGRDVETYTNMDIDALGVDINEQEIESARRLRPRCKFQVGDICHLPFPDSSIDACSMLNVIHYLDQRAALEEIRRVLVPSGLLFVHFNLLITDSSGRVDYSQEEPAVRELIARWKMLVQHDLKRVDPQPVEHTHSFLELVLQK